MPHPKKSLGQASVGWISKADVSAFSLVRPLLCEEKNKEGQEQIAEREDPIASYHGDIFFFTLRIDRPSLSFSDLERGRKFASMISFSPFRERDSFHPLTACDRKRAAKS